MSRAILAALIGVTCVVSPVEAQDAEPPPEYQELIRQALEESSANRWAEARVFFRQAHEAFPNARTERGIGMVSFELRDYTDAVRHLTRALDDPRRPGLRSRRPARQRNPLRRSERRRVDGRTRPRAR